VFVVSVVVCYAYAVEIVVKCDFAIFHMRAPTKQNDLSMPSPSKLSSELVKSLLDLLKRNKSREF
jgi:hypothetical protein